MRRTLTALCLSVITFGCGKAASESNAPLLDQIEAQVVLPSGSQPFAKYSRYYAPGPHGTIDALYVIHLPENFVDAGKTCRRLKENTFPCSASGGIELVPAGSRRWLADPRDLPFIHGGGCYAIRFAYEPKSAKFSPLECNGSY